MASPRRSVYNTGRSMPDSPSRALASLSLNSPTKPTTRKVKTKGPDDSSSPIKTSKSARSSPVKTPSSKRSGGAGGLGRDVFAADTEIALNSSPSRKRKSVQNKQYDRFIPNRSNSAASLPIGAELTANSNSDNATRAELTDSLGVDLNRRILAFSKEPPPSSTEQSNILTQYAKAANKSTSSNSALAASQRRRIASAPERILDAPGLVDDYYLNLIDWSVDNLVAVSLDQALYMWNAETSACQVFCDLNESSSSQEDPGYITSVRFSEDGSFIAVGTTNGEIQLYDISTAKKVRTIRGHLSRIPSLSWAQAILSSGSRDGSIWNSDVRVAEHKISEMKNHRAEVCGLEWRKDYVGGMSSAGQGLLASGGNDNVVNVWDGRNPTTPRMTKTNHTAAVKALAWCPWQSNVLATGGGSNDKTIHIWNVTSNARTQSHQTSSQVTSLLFNPHARELMSTHGVPDNQVTIWSYPSLTKIHEISHAHESRILGASLSPDGCVVLTSSSDENLKFWKLFEQRKAVSSSSKSMAGSSSKRINNENEDIGKRGKTNISIR